MYENFEELKTGFIGNVTTNIKCIHANIRSCRLNWDYWLAEFETADIFWDIIVFTEINLNECEISAYNLKNYDKFYNCRKNQKGGGILIFYKEDVLKDVTSKNIKIEENDAITLSFKLNDQLFEIIALYKKPSASRIKFIKELKQLIKDKCYKLNLILIGDFNFNLLKSSQDTSEKYDIERFENVMASLGFTQQINSPTREETRNNKIVKSCIDLIYNKTKNWDCKSYVIKIKLADHYFTAFQLWDRKTFEKTKQFKQLFDYKYNNANIIRQLNNNNWNYLKTFTNPNQIYNEIEEQIKAIYENNKIFFKKIIKNKTFKTDWMNNDLLTKINYKNKLWSQISKLTNPTKEQLDHYKEINRQVKNYINFAKQTHYKEFFKNNRKDSAKIWEKINSICGKKKGTQNLDEQIKKNFSNLDSKTICENFAEYYQQEVPNLKNTKKGIKIKNTRKSAKKNLQENRIKNTIQILKPNIYDILAIINKMNVTKSCGHEGFFMDHFYQTKEQTAFFMQILISSIIDTEIWPLNMKKQVLRPIYKKGDKQGYNNYRPIALLPVLNKIVEKFFATRILDFLTKHNLLNKHQFGFQQHKGTIDALNYINNNINRALNEGKHIGAVFIDLKKAFDTLDKETLYEKLYKYGIRGKILKILINYLTNRSSSVKIDNTCSTWKEVTFGVPQGSVLGPLLFLIYINDIVDCTSSTLLTLYADDIFMMSINYDQNIMIKNLQSDFDKINNYFTENELYISAEKTCFMHITTSHMVKKNCTIYLHDNNCTKSPSCNCTKLNQVTNIKYLGLDVDQNWKFYYHIESLIKKIRQTIPTLYMIKDFINCSVKKTLYEAWILSKVRYACTIFGSTSTNLIERLQKTINKAVKALFGTQKGKTTQEIYSENKLFTFRQLYKFSIITNNYYDSTFKIANLRPSRNNNAWLQTPNWRNSYGKRGLVYIVPQIFNEIPPSLRKLENINKMRKLIKVWILGSLS